MDELEHAIENNNLNLVTDILKKNPGLRKLYRCVHIFEMVIRNRNYDMMKLLPDKRIHSQSSYAYCEKLLHIAVITNDQNLILFLLDHGEHIDEVESRGNTALNLILYEKFPNIEIIKLLLEQDADPNIPEYELGDTPLIKVCYYGTERLQIAQLLLEYGADANIPNKDGNRPLDIAIIADYTELMKLLLDYGANRELIKSYEFISEDCRDILKNYGIFKLTKRAR